MSVVAVLRVQPRLELGHHARFSPLAIERGVFAALEQARGFYKEGRFAFPLVAALSMENVVARVLVASREDAKPLPVARITFEPLVITDAAVPGWKLLKPWADLLWQAAGWMRAFTYNEDGRWCGADSP
jgi:hypothetical protein